MNYKGPKITWKKINQGRSRERKNELLKKQRDLVKKKRIREEKKNQEKNLEGAK